MFATFAITKLTNLVLCERQVLLHQALRGCESCVHSTADQLGHAAVQHCADAPTDNSLGLLHAILHRPPSLFHNAGQSVWDGPLGPSHNLFSAAHHILGTGNNLGRRKNNTDKWMPLSSEWLQQKDELEVGEEKAVEKHGT